MGRGRLRSLCWKVLCYFGEGMGGLGYVMSCGRVQAQLRVLRRGGAVWQESESGDAVCLSPRERATWARIEESLKPSLGLTARRAPRSRTRRGVHGVH